MKEKNDRMFAVAERKRECWIDIAKTIACILVVIGHFIMSMDDIYRYGAFWGFTVKTIYYFHVPIFFYCSGYLYYATGKKENGYVKNFIGKVFDLGVPYVTFSFLTIVLKQLAMDSVNNPIERNPVHILLISPIAPYWFLYALILMFLIPRLPNRPPPWIRLTIIIVAVVVYFLPNYTDTIPIIVSFCKNLIWFVLGMVPIRYRKSLMFFVTLLFFGLSIYYYIQSVTHPMWVILISALGVWMIILISKGLEKIADRRMILHLSQYFMPIFLMHTIAAAPIRILLLKLNVINPVIHTLVGLPASFLLPVLVAEIARKTVVFDFFMYPSKTIKFLRKRMNK